MIDRPHPEHRKETLVSQRLTYRHTAPEPYRLLRQLNDYTAATVQPTLLELVKVRASVLNGCAFCVDMHAADALRAGERAQRLFAVATWRESTFFTETERVALELTDAVTRLGEHGVPEELWDRASAIFGDKALADLLTAIIVINAFNRVAVSTRMEATLREG